MHDYHVHIGQFNEIYYDYHDVFFAVKENGISEITLAYLTPKFNDEKCAVDFYHAVVEELKQAKQYANKIGLIINILHWAEPLLFSARISLNKIFENFEYKGIALHPVLHDWSKSHADKLTEIFKFADFHNLPIYIHTGCSECDQPLQFEKWFKDFPKVEVHLAHCKDPKAIISLFSKYKNIYGDTAFCPSDSYNAICEAGFKDRMFYGTDFPITHYYEQINNKNRNNDKKILTTHYAKLISDS